MNLSHCLPILEELSHSDLWILLLFSAALSLLIGRSLKTGRAKLRAVFGAFLVYASCETAMHLVSLFLAELLLLFLGVFALGFLIGTLVGWILSLWKHR